MNMNQVHNSGMETVRLSTDLAAPAHRVWDAVTVPATLLLVTQGLMRLPELERRTRGWTPGETAVTRVLLLGIVPVSRHRITVVEVDDVARVIRTVEGGGVVRQWRHTIRVEALADQRCRYTDEVAIDAGPLTGAVAWFARRFYAVRQRRWRRLAPVLAGSSAPSPTLSP